MPAFDQRYLPFESAADDVLASAFHAAGSDHRSAFPVETVSHSVRVGFIVTSAYREVFGPVAARLRSGDDLSGPPGVQRSSVPIGLQFCVWMQLQHEVFPCPIPGIG